MDPGRRVQFFTVSSHIGFGYYPVIRTDIRPLVITVTPNATPPQHDEARSIQKAVTIFETNISIHVRVSGCLTQFVNNKDINRAVLLRLVTVSWHAYNELHLGEEVTKNAGSELRIGHYVDIKHTSNEEDMMKYSKLKVLRLGFHTSIFYIKLAFEKYNPIQLPSPVSFEKMHVAQFTISGKHEISRGRPTSTHSWR
jgi:hypothetical protein